MLIVLTAWSRYCESQQVLSSEFSLVGRRGGAYQALKNR